MSCCNMSGTSLPSSGKRQRQFLKTKNYGEGVICRLLWYVAAASVPILIVCTRNSSTDFKNNVYTVVKNSFFYR